MDGGDAQKEEVAAGHESVGRCVGWFFRVHLQRRVSQGVAAELSDEGNVHHLERHVLLLADGASDFDFLGVLLPVGESEGVHLLKMAQRPKEAGGRILSAREDDKRFVSFHKVLVSWERARLFFGIDALAVEVVAPVL